MGDRKKTLKKLWRFIWEDDSIWSWLVNIILAFVIIKFLVYPGLGFVLQTSHPVVAVVSESMEHDANFENWWLNAGDWYISHSINQKDFNVFSFNNGFNKGDIMVLKGKSPGSISIGDIIVFWSARKDPIIHRVVRKWQQDGIYYFQTKGDNYKTNPSSISNQFLDETKISEEQIVGIAVFRIPFLGYIKIGFVNILDILRNLPVQKG